MKLALNAVYNEIHNTLRRHKMFKFIGAAVVYGFATYGLLVWLQRSKNNKECVKEASS